MLSETALAVYRHLVANPEVDADATAFDLGLTREQLDEAGGELLAAKLVQVTHNSRRRMVALAPEVALGRSVYDDERMVRELQARINAQRAGYLSLVPHYTEARALAVRSADIQVLEDLPTIRDFLAEACRDTRRELLIAHPTRHLSARSLAEGLPQDLEMLARGVIRRTLYLKSNRDSIAVRRAVASATEAGAEVRVLPIIPVRVMCFDASTAMVSRNESPDDKAAIVVRDTRLARICRQVFLAAWELAEPFAQSEDASARPSQIELAILAGLAQGHSDEHIARRQGISVRTCRRHVHNLIERLGAQSRFQAGVLAAKLNWL